jgi:beta-lactam-binding protein with PASTA domain/predicted Ser/Thr protein kinase
MTDVPDTSTIIDGRYRVLHRVGSGGMADVVCAEDLQLGRKVAIKLLHRRFAQDEEFVERFRREASSAAGLQHPHVVAVYDRGAWDDTYYIAMEYLEGRTLKKLVQEEAPLAAPRAIDLTIQILRAARFAHKRGIIHRDLKPHNVIIDDAVPPARAKVTDFGIAKAGASDMTQTGSIMGTAQYLSPEQAQGHAVSAPSDLYSVGIILYEMLTGRVPFEGESAVTIALKQVGEAPVPPSQRNPAVPPALEAVVMKALEKDPARRFADADEFIAALEHAGQGISPPPAPATGATSVLQATGPMIPIPPPGAYQDVAQVEQRYYGPPAPPPVDEGDDGDGPSRWWVALLVGLVVAGAIVAGLLLTGKDKVQVPNVVGNPQAESEILLKRKGLSTDVTLKESPTAPKGTVTGQDPGGGSRVPKGSVVGLTVSAGPGTARVPDLAGKARNAAKQQLVALGFNVTEERTTSDTVTENHVIATRPDVGTELDKGTGVVLVVSSGKERVAVPKVTDLTEDEARSTLEALGFQVSSKEKETDEKDPGTVLEQSPATDTKLAKGGTVSLTVAKAPAEVDVPDVTGQGRLAATAALRKAGFVVDQTTQKTGDRTQDVHVISQDPASGGKAKKGSTVTLTVGEYDATLDQGAGTTTPSTTAPGDTVTTP